MTILPPWWPEATRCATLLPRAIARHFSREDRERVTATLSRSYPLTGESARIGLAIVYLANGDLAALDRWVHEAEKDWRDVLVAAEYRPTGSGAWDLGPKPAYFTWIAELERS